MRDESFAEPLRQFLDAHPRTRLLLDLKHAFLRTNVPQVNKVDGIARRINAHKAECDGDVLRASFVPDDVQQFKPDSFRAGDVGAGGSSESKLKLSRFHARKNFRAELSAHKNDDQSCRDDV